MIKQWSIMIEIMIHIIICRIGYISYEIKRIFGASASLYSYCWFYPWTSWYLSPNNDQASATRLRRIPNRDTADLYLFIGPLSTRSIMIPYFHSCCLLIPWFLYICLSDFFPILWSPLSTIVDHVMMLCHSWMSWSIVNLCQFAIMHSFKPSCWLVSHCQSLRLFVMLVVPRYLPLFSSITSHGEPIIWTILV